MQRLMNIPTWSTLNGGGGRDTAGAVSGSGSEYYHRKTVGGATVHVIIIRDCARKGASGKGRGMNYFLSKLIKIQVPKL